jgi:hypothetical protein
MRKLAQTGITANWSDYARTCVSRGFQGDVRCWDNVQYLTQKTHIKSDQEWWSLDGSVNIVLV